MARIAGVNIPTQKRVVIALTYITGIGPAKAKEITTKDRAKLGRYLAGAFVAVTTILEKGEFDSERFAAEVRRAMSGRLLVA